MKDPKSRTIVTVPRRKRSGGSRRRFGGPRTLRPLRLHGCAENRFIGCCGAGSMPSIDGLRAGVGCKAPRLPGGSGARRPTMGVGGAVLSRRAHSRSMDAGDMGSAGACAQRGRPNSGRRNRLSQRGELRRGQPRHSLVARARADDTTKRYRSLGLVRPSARSGAPARDPLRDPGPVVGARSRAIIERPGDH